MKNGKILGKAKENWFYEKVENTKYNVENFLVSKKCLYA